MIVYKKNANLVLGIIGLLGGPLFFLMAYLAKEYDNDTFSFYRFCIYGVVGIVFGIFCLREYILHKLELVKIM